MPRGRHSRARSRPAIAQAGKRPVSISPARLGPREVHAIRDDWLILLVYPLTTATGTCATEAEVDAAILPVGLVRNGFRREEGAVGGEVLFPLDLAGDAARGDILREHVREVEDVAGVEVHQSWLLRPRLKPFTNRMSNCLNAGRRSVLMPPWNPPRLQAKGVRTSSLPLSLLQPV